MAEVRSSSRQAESTLPAVCCRWLYAAARQALCSTVFHCPNLPACLPSMHLAYNTRPAVPLPNPFSNQPLGWSPARHV
jgi:hypothetical protein